MPVIIIYGINEDKVTQKQLTDFLDLIKSRVCSIEELNLTEDLISVFFPKDCLAAGLGEEIIITVEGLFNKPERTEAVRRRLAIKLMEAAYATFPDGPMIECFICLFDEKWGYAHGKPMDVG